MVKRKLSSKKRISNNNTNNQCSTLLQKYKLWLVVAVAIGIISLATIGFLVLDLGDGALAGKGTAGADGSQSVPPQKLTESQIQANLKAIGWDLGLTEKPGVGDSYASCTADTECDSGLCVPRDLENKEKYGKMCTASCVDSCPKKVTQFNQDLKCTNYNIGKSETVNICFGLTEKKPDWLLSPAVNAIAGEAWTDCQDNSDCDSSYCIPRDEKYPILGKMCTTTCDSGCPVDVLKYAGKTKSLDCQIAGSGDPVYICKMEFCKGEGLTNNAMDLCIDNEYVPCNEKGKIEGDYICDISQNGNKRWMKIEDTKKCATNWVYSTSTGDSSKINKCTRLNSNLIKLVNPWCATVAGVNSDGEYVSESSSQNYGWINCPVSKKGEYCDGDSLCSNDLACYGNVCSDKCVEGDVSKDLKTVCDANGNFVDECIPTVVVPKSTGNVVQESPIAKTITKSGKNYCEIISTTGRDQVITLTSTWLTCDSSTKGKVVPAKESTNFNSYQCNGEKWVEYVPISINTGGRTPITLPDVNIPSNVDGGSQVIPTGTTLPTITKACDSSNSCIILNNHHLNQKAYVLQPDVNHYLCSKTDGNAEKCGTKLRASSDLWQTEWTVKKVTIESTNTENEKIQDEYVVLESSHLSNGAPRTLAATDNPVNVNFISPTTRVQGTGNFYDKNGYQVLGGWNSYWRFEYNTGLKVYLKHPKTNYYLCGSTSVGSDKWNLKMFKDKNGNPGFTCSWQFVPVVVDPKYAAEDEKCETSGTVSTDQKFVCKEGVWKTPFITEGQDCTGKTNQCDTGLVCYTGTKVCGKKILGDYDNNGCVSDNDFSTATKEWFDTKLSDNDFSAITKLWFNTGSTCK